MKRAQEICRGRERVKNNNNDKESSTKTCQSLYEKIMGWNLEIRLQTKKPEIKNAASLQSICVNGLNKQNYSNQFKPHYAHVLVMVP